jgi:hypothetical protein
LTTATAPCTKETPRQFQGRKSWSLLVAILSPTLHKSSSSCCTFLLSTSLPSLPSSTPPANTFNGVDTPCYHELRND